MLNWINLGVHFVLEMCMLAAVVAWGFMTGDSVWLKILLGILLPLLMAAVWGIFRVPNDPGRAVVAVPGWVRLLIEWGFFAFAVWCLFAAGWPTLGWIFLIAAVVNYAGMHERIGRILRVG